MYSKMKLEKFIQNYSIGLQKLLDEVDVHAISEIIETFDAYADSGRKIFFIGNGGSAATASHMVNDFGTGLRRRGILNLNVISLADNSAVITAVANDIGYENTFYMQIKDVITKDDALFAISCSGNSSNIIKAAEYAKKIGSKIIGVTGFEGGKLRAMSDINFHVPTASGEYGLCEDMHMILDHIIYSFYTQDQND